MKKLFSMTMQVAGDRVITVSETLNGGVKIEGQSLEAADAIRCTGIWFSAEATEALCSILNIWREEKFK